MQNEPSFSAQPIQTKATSAPKNKPTKAASSHPRYTENSRARLHPDSRCASPQPQEHFAFYSPQPTHRGDRRLGVRKIVAGLRHHLRRGPAALRGIALGLRAPVPGAHGKAGGGRDRWHRAGGGHPAEKYHPESALHRRHFHRMLRFPAPALCPRGPDVLPHMRHARPQGYRGRSGRAPDGIARRVALVRAVPLRRACQRRRPCATTSSSCARRASTACFRPARSSNSPRPNRSWTSISRSPSSCWWTASPSVPTCTSAWSTPSRSAIARPAK